MSLFQTKKKEQTESVLDFLQPKKFNALTEDVLSRTFGRPSTPEEVLFQPGSRAAEVGKAARLLGEEVKEKSRTPVQNFFKAARNTQEKLFEIINPGESYLEPALEKRGVSPKLAFAIGLGVDILAPGPGEFKRLKLRSKPTATTKVASETIEGVENSPRLVVPEVGEAGSRNRYFNRALQPDERGPVKFYEEEIYQGPARNSAIDVHYKHVGSGEVPDYFAHVRRDVMDDGGVRLNELQSDLFQKRRIDKEIELLEDIKLSDPSRAEEITERISKLEELKNLRNTWHKPIIEQEVRKAAERGAPYIEFPDGKTIAKIQELDGAYINPDYVAKTHPVSKFYDRQVQKYLKQQYGDNLVRHVDESGNGWYRVKLNKDILGKGSSESGRISRGALTGIAGGITAASIFGAPILDKVLNAPNPSEMAEDLILGAKTQQDLEIAELAIKQVKDKDTRHRLIQMLAQMDSRIRNTQQSDKATTSIFNN